GDRDHLPPARLSLGAYSGGPETGAGPDLPDAGDRDQDADHPDLLVRPLGVRPGQALPADGRRRLPETGRRHGEPAERGSALRPGPDLDRRRRQTGQMVSAAEARMAEKPRRRPPLRQPGQARDPALEKLKGFF